MEDYQKRVIDEKKELDAKHTKLIEFTESIGFEHLTRSDQLLLEKQSVIMDMYSKVLGERIAGFK